jgi:hypothetical protein
VVDEGVARPLGKQAAHVVQRVNQLRPLGHTDGNAVLGVLVDGDGVVHPVTRLRHSLSRLGDPDEIPRLPPGIENYEVQGLVRAGQLVNSIETLSSCRKRTVMRRRLALASSMLSWLGTTAATSDTDRGLWRRRETWCRFEHCGIKFFLTKI